jgi:hypothetical protein
MERPRRPKYHHMPIINWAVSVFLTLTAHQGRRRQPPSERRTAVTARSLSAPARHLHTDPTQAVLQAASEPAPAGALRRRGLGQARDSRRAGGPRWRDGPAAAAERPPGGMRSRHPKRARAESGRRPRPRPRGRTLPRRSSVGATLPCGRSAARAQPVGRGPNGLRAPSARWPLSPASPDGCTTPAGLCAGEHTASAQGRAASARAPPARARRSPARMGAAP